MADTMIGKVVSHYRVEEKLGGGGMGVVYRAVDTRLNRPVALKFLPPALTGDDDARRRFMLEAQAASALDHPNICTIHEIDTTADDQLFIAMAYYEGATLKTRIAGGPLPIGEAVDIVAQIARGLVKAHAAGIIHRDIKPANVMITDDGFVKIVDFGIAKLMGQTGPTQSGTTLGTVSYMAPEQVNGEAVDRQTDVWALGAVFYEMLTGRPPFEGDRPVVVMNAIAQQPLTPPSTLRDEITPDIEAVVTKALEKDRQTRYATARDFLEDISAGETVVVSAGVKATAGTEGGPARWLRPAVLVSALALAAAVVIGVVLSSGGSDARLAREETLPRIQALIEEDRTFEAFALAQQTEAVLGDDPALVELWPLMSSPGSVVTDPAGARVSFRAYGRPDSEWTEIGTTPVEQVRLPVGIFALRVESPGFQPRSLLVANPSFFLGNLGGDPTTISLVETGTRDDNVVPVPSRSVSGTAQGMITGNDPIAPIPLGAYFIDTYETTNGEFKAFVDAGGYETREYWQHPFAGPDGSLAWDEAMRELVDATGRPGPSTWELGTYPDGAADLPVTGVSWYEAAAYAAFRGKHLPTIYHWATASGRDLASEIVATSNFGTDGPGPVSESGGLGPFGTFGMAGNVREWCFNASGDDRWILGGAWNDPVYLFTFANVQSPFDRSPTNGFRLVEYGDEDGPSEESVRAVELSHRDYYAETPVSDEIFEVYREQFSYDRVDLEAVVEETDDSVPDWSRQVVSFTAAYDDERMKAVLFIPTVGAPPYQAVVLFPGSYAPSVPSSESIGRMPAITALYDFLIRSGRAVVVPVYKGTYERNDGLTSTWANSTVRYTGYVIKWVQDLQRSIDYLETRDDIDVGRLAYLGLSWGARMGAIIPAVEPRLKTAIFYLGGLASGRARPEVDQLNYVTRVTVPVLMLNGRYDAIEPLETSQLPMLDLLGTPEADKRHVLFDTDHAVPRNAGIRETLDWLDEYLGPVD